MKIITLLFTYNSRITTRYLEQDMTLHECLRRCTGMCNDSWVACMKEFCTVALPQIQCQLHDHASNMTMMDVSWWTRWRKVAWQYISEWLWECHNRKVWCLFWGRYKVGLWYRRKLRGTREASNGGRVRVRIIHGLNISHKELTYLLQKSISYWNKVLRTCS